MKVESDADQDTPYDRARQDPPRRREEYRAGMRTGEGLRAARALVPATRYRRRWKWRRRR